MEFIDVLFTKRSFVENKLLDDKNAFTKVKYQNSDTTIIALAMIK